MVDSNWKMLLIEEYVSILEKYKCEKNVDLRVGEIQNIKSISVSTVLA